MNIHFICRGNVLRSLIAETYLRSLNITGISTISSGTNVDWSDPAEKQYFANTIALLTKKGIQSCAKAAPNQLTQERADVGDITICMNGRVFEEASELTRLSSQTVTWDIVDIGEEGRTDTDSREIYEEQIYREITSRVDKLAKTI